MFTTFLPDRGRFRICFDSQCVQVCVIGATKFQCRVTAALQGLPCSLFTGLFPKYVTLAGWATEHRRPFVGFFSRGFSSRDAWLSGGQHPVCPHTSTTFMLMAHNHITELQTYI